MATAASTSSSTVTSHSAPRRAAAAIGHRGQGLGLQPGEGDAGTALVQALGQGGADAPGGPGDQHTSSVAAHPSIGSSAAASPHVSVGSSPARRASMNAVTASAVAGRIEPWSAPSITVSSVT